MAKFETYSPLIIEQVKLGMTFNDSCEIVGIDRVTGWRWREKFATFATEVNQAELEFKRLMIARVANGSAKNPALALTVLERKYRDEWGRNDKLELSGQIDLNKLYADSDGTNKTDKLLSENAK